MPGHEHLVRCGGLNRSARGARALVLDLHGPDQNVVLKIEDIDQRLGSSISDELVDLLEIAAYVYAADSAVSRGGKSDARLGLVGDDGSDSRYPFAGLNSGCRPLSRRP
jgi:hypothetical protein